jgi:hypothetical protein
MLIGFSLPNRGHQTVEHMFVIELIGIIEQTTLDLGQQAIQRLQDGFPEVGGAMSYF